MTKFVIQGNIDQVRVGLKSALDAQDANFKANMSALFKPAPPMQPVQRATPPAAPAHTPPAAGKFTLGSNRNRRFS